jgi:hypothetical protein
VPAEELAPYVEPDGHRGGSAVDLAEGPLLFWGGTLPHHRPPHAGPGQITLVTFCFGEEPAHTAR